MSAIGRAALARQKAAMGRDSPLVQYADLWESSQRNTPLCKGESLRRLNVLRPANRWAREIEPCHRFQLRPKRGAIVGGMDERSDGQTPAGSALNLPEHVRPQHGHGNLLHGGGQGFGGQFVVRYPAPVAGVCGKTIEHLVGAMQLQYQVEMRERVFDLFLRADPA